MKVDYEPVGRVTVQGRVIAGLAVGSLALGALTWGGYEAGWWLKAQNVNRSAAINHQSLAFQQAKVEEVNRKMEALASLKSLDKDPTIGQDQVAANKAQEQAITNIICMDWRQITPSYRDGMDTDLVNTTSAMCQLGQ